MRNLFLAFLLSLLLISPVAVQAETLQIGIEHAEYLPPVSAQSGYLQAQPNPNPSYTAGVTQRTAPAKPRAPLVEWFQMPNVMAGKWTKRGDITLDVTDLRTGMTRQVGSWTDNEMTMTLGHQMDRAGNVWHVNVLPSERDSISDGKMVRFLTVQQTCEKYSPSMLCTRTHYVITETYGGSGQVADMFQQESLNRYTILPTGELQNLSSNRVFSYSGQPVRDGTLQSKFRKVGAFQPTAELSGIDLASALDRYLLAQGRADLAPQRPAGAQQEPAQSQYQPQFQSQFQPQSQQPYQRPYQQPYQRPYQQPYQQPSVGF